MNQTTDDHPHSKIEKTTHSKIRFDHSPPFPRRPLWRQLFDETPATSHLSSFHQKWTISKLKIWLICNSNKYWKRPNTDHVGGNDHDSFALESGKRFHLSSPSSRVDVRLVQDVVPEKSQLSNWEWWLVNVWGPVEWSWGLGVFLEVDKENQFESFKVSWPSPFIGKIKNLILDKM